MGRLPPTTPYGGTSQKLNEYQDMFSKVNGGQFSSCLQNDYQKDYLTDMKMKDQRQQNMRVRVSLASFRRDNAAQLLREMDSKRKMQAAEEHKERSLQQKPIVMHKPGFVPHFYPTRLVEKTLKGEQAVESES